MFQDPPSWTTAIPTRYLQYLLGVMTTGAIALVAKIIRAERQRLNDIDANVKNIRDNHLTHIEAATKETSQKLDLANQHLAEQTGYLKAMAERRDRDH